MNHTPGPWKEGGFSAESQGSVIFTEREPRRDIAYIAGGNVQHNANARLIASAPELLEQCTILCDAIREFTAGMEWPELEPAWKVINKAKGQ